MVPGEKEEIKKNTLKKRGRERDRERIDVGGRQKCEKGKERKRK